MSSILTSRPGSDSPRRPVVRQLLRMLLKTDANLNAFCLDYFPDAYHRFALGMDRLSKVNLLLELTEPAQVLSRLREHYVQDPDALTIISSQLAERDTDEAQQAWALREKLESLYVLREQRRLHGQDLNDLNTQIVTIKRAQRQAPQLQEGEILSDRYRLVDIVGRGGFGRVWQSFDRQSHRLVAIKVLHREQGEDTRRVERFTRGARQMKELEHPSIVRVLDEPAEYNGFHYFVMDYLPGGDLFQALTTGVINRTQALHAVLAVGAALEHAHARHLIHRDVKPQNILLDGLGGARLTDFDLVWAADTTGGTHTGFLGTHLYVAPEQAEDAKAIDARADIYSLAMTTLFVLWERALPQRAIYQRALFIDELKCDEPAKALLRQATAIDPDDRPNSIAEFCSRLADVLAECSVGSPSLEPTAEAPQQSESMLFTPPVASTVSPSLSRLAAEVQSSPKQSRYRLSKVMFRLAVVAALLASVGGVYIWWANRPPHVDPESKAVALLLEIDKDLADKRWTQASSKADRLVGNPAVSPSIREAVKTRRIMADRERGVQTAYDRLASLGQDYDQLVRLYKQIPADSAYHQSAREIYEKLFPLFVGKHLKAAEDARTLGKCDEFRNEVKAVLDLDPKQIQALTTKDRPCAEQSVMGVGGPPPIATLSGHRVKRGEDERPSTETPHWPPPAAANQILAKAEAELASGNFLQSISLAESVQNINSARAKRIISAAVDQTLAKAEAEFVNGNLLQSINLAESVQRLNLTRARRVIKAAADQTLTKAEGELANSKFRESISLAESVQRLKPTRAWRILGAAACHIRDTKLANEAFNNLDAVDRPQLISVCQRQGIIHTSAADSKASNAAGGSGTTDKPTISTKVLASAEKTDEVLSNAQTEYVNGNFSQSISLAKSVQNFNPIRAWRIIGASACNMKDIKLASESFKQLDAASRQYLTYTCQRQGITNTNGSDFRLNQQ